MATGPLAVVQFPRLLTYVEGTLIGLCLLPFLRLVGRGIATVIEIIDGQETIGREKGIISAPNSKFVDISLRNLSLRCTPTAGIPLGRHIGSLAGSFDMLFGRLRIREEVLGKCRRQIGGLQCPSCLSQR